MQNALVGYIGVYSDTKNEFVPCVPFYSIKLYVDIVPGQPVRLVPVQNPGTPTVSNTKNLASRTLLRSLKFELKVSQGVKFNHRSLAVSYVKVYFNWALALASALYCH